MNMQKNPPSLVSQLKSLLIRSRGEFKRSSALYYLKSSCFQMPAVLPAARPWPLPYVWDISNKLDFKKMLKQDSDTRVHVKICACQFAFLIFPCNVRHWHGSSLLPAEGCNGIFLKPRNCFPKGRNSQSFSYSELLRSWFYHTSVYPCLMVLNSQTNQDIKSYQSLSLVVH